MKNTLSVSRKLVITPLFAALIVALQAPTVPANAQHFYDHDRQWKHGSAEAGGLVPDDFLVPVPTGDISRSSPPMGMHVTKASLRQREAQAPQYFEQQPFYSPKTQRNYSLGKRTTTGGKQYDDSMDWVNGLGGNNYGNFSVDQVQKQRYLQLQKQKAQQSQPKLHIKPLRDPNGFQTLGRVVL